MRRDSFVTIGLPNGLEFYEAVVAVWKLGATPQPISSRLPAAERRAIIDLANSSLVVGVDPAETPGRATIPAGFEPDPSLSRGAAAAAVAASFKAPTSGGSTGRPKLIVATQARRRGRRSKASRRVLRIPRDGVHLVTGPLYHNGPFTTSLLALLAGNHLVVMPRFDAAGALALIAQHRVDWMYAVPTMMHRIWRLPDARARAATTCRRCASSSTWRRRVRRGSSRRGSSGSAASAILELYGGTEAQAITVITGTEWLAHRGSVGRPVLGEMIVLDARRQRAAAGRGRRDLDAPRAPRRRRPTATSARRRSRAPADWESLGDMGWKDEDGYVYLSDRDTDMILVGGANVYPAEVEAALDEHPRIASSCVIGLPDDEYGNRRARDRADGGAGRARRAREVPRRAPREIQACRAPTSSSREPLRGDDGKVRRSALRAARLATRGA